LACQQTEARGQETEGVCRFTVGLGVPSPGLRPPSRVRLPPLKRGILMCKPADFKFQTADCRLMAANSSIPFSWGRRCPEGADEGVCGERELVVVRGVGVSGELQHNDCNCWGSRVHPNLRTWVTKFASIAIGIGIEGNSEHSHAVTDISVITLLKVHGVSVKKVDSAKILEILAIYNRFWAVEDVLRTRCNWKGFRFRYRSRLRFG